MARIFLVAGVVSTALFSFTFDEATTKQVETVAERRAKLTGQYLEQLASLRQTYETQFEALKNEEISEVRSRLEAAMKALSLEEANRLNAEVRRLGSELATTKLRSVFVRNSARGERAYFIRGMGGEWIERFVSRRGESTVVYKNVVETPEYVELSQEAGGSVHRLYEQLDMHMDPRNGKNEFVEVGGGRWIYADTAARVADAVPSATGGTRLVDAELGAFCDALTRITWKGIRRGWQNDFYFASGGRVMTLDGKEMPQQWFPVAPGHIVTVHAGVIDSLSIDIHAGTLESRAFSETEPLATWKTTRFPEGNEQ
jgi:hypothetical protein